MSTQGISLNGTSQSATGTVPNTAAFSAVGNHQYIMRASNLGGASNSQYLFDSVEGIAVYNGASGVLTTYFYRASDNVYLNLGSLTDVVIRVTVNGGTLTVEAWNAALTTGSYISGTATLSPTTAIDWRASVFAIGETGTSASWARENVDFFRIATTLSTLGAANPPTYAYNASLTYLTRWEFETNTTDSGPNGFNLTANGSPGYVTMPNVLPTASATTSASAYNVGTVVTLNGSGSKDPDGTLTYAWTQTAGTTATLSSATAISPTLTTPTITREEVMTFHLVVTDNDSATSSADVSFYNVPAVVANAGPDVSAKTLEPVSLRGDVSSVSIYAASWTYGDGETNQKMARATHAYMTPGTYTATLTVTSRLGTTATDTAIVTVTDPGTGGTVYTATSAADFQTKLNTVVGGDVIEIAAGSNFVGNFNLPVHTGSTYVTIRVQNFATNFTRKKRVTAADIANMATLSFSNNAGSAILTSRFANYWRFQGIQFKQTGGVSVNAVVYINSSGDYPNTVQDADLPHHYIFDHVRITTVAGIIDTKKGIAAEAKYLSVVDSEIAPIIHTGQDSQAIQTTTGSGPFAFVNNHFQAIGENILFGGTDPHVRYQATMSAATATSATLGAIYDIAATSLGSPRDLHVGDTISIPIAGTSVYGGYTRRNRVDAIVLSISGNNITFTNCGATPNLASTASPISAAADEVSQVEGLRWNNSARDVEITKSYFDHDVAWRNVYAGQKNLFETKNAEHVYLSRMVFENEWDEAQQIAIVFKAVTQNGVAVASTARDVHLVDSMVRHVCGGFVSIEQSNYGYTSRLKRHSLYNVLFDDIDHIGWSGAGAPGIDRGIAFEISAQKIDDVDIQHVTAIPSNTGIFLDGLNGANFTYRDNISGKTVTRSGGTPGLSSITDQFGSSYVWTNNVHVISSSVNYPGGATNYYPATTTAVGFVDAANGNYTLANSSPYKGTGTGGSDPGVNMTTLSLALGASALTFNSATFKSITGDWGNNLPPTVNAGADQNLSAGTTSTTLTGTASDPEGDPLTQTWSRISGPNTPTIVSPSALSTSVTGMIAGTYIFRLTVNDGVNANVTDDVQVIIASAAASVCKWDTNPACS